MKSRLLTAAVGIPLMLALLFWPGGLPWVIGITAVTLVACAEYTKALGRVNIHVHWMALLLYALVLMYFALPNAEGPEWWSNYIAEPFGMGLGRFGERLWGMLLVLLFTGEILRKVRSPLKNIGATLLGIGYIGALFPYLVQLRYANIAAGEVSYEPLPAGLRPFGFSVGAWLVLCVLFTVWAGDTAAYFSGRTWGKHKCAPAISPNKTWEGVIGGLAASAVVGGLMAAAFPGPPPAWHWVVPFFGLLVGAAGQIGDLFESALKREIGIKDFGGLLPGHGGILDRFDSLLFAAPVAFWLFQCFLLPNSN